MKAFVTAIVAVSFVVGALGQRPSAGEHWVATWGAAPQLYRAATTPAPAQPAPPAPVAPPAAPQRRFGIPPALPGLSDQTVRMILRTSIGGTGVRVRLANAFGAPTVTIGAAHIAVRDKDSAIVPGSDRAITFAGRNTATIYAGQVLVSDPIRLDVRPLSDLAVSLYFPGDTGAPTTHLFGLRPTYVTGRGNHTGAAALSDLQTTTQSYYWLTGVDVFAPATAATVVTFGDSITDGDQSTPVTNGMWPAILATRLKGRAATAAIGVANAGISGNRLLGDNTSGVARFLRDALGVPGVKWITVLEGINDITNATRASQSPGSLTSDDLTAANRQLIETAHLYGVKVIGCTITPYGGSTVHTEQGEAIRQAVNTWIRTSGAFDAVFDFDAATRDPQDPRRFRPEADAPDMLHPGDAGYKLMADSIDLSVFNGTRSSSARPGSNHDDQR